MVMNRLLLSALLLLPLGLFAQTASRTGSPSPEPAYLRFPEVPPFKMVEPSGKVFTNKDLKKRTPTLMFLFSVDCEHCQHETEWITQHIDEFKNSQIIMITPFGYKDMVGYYRGYGIDRYPNIHMGSDSTRQLNFFYQMRFFPGLYVYDKKGKIVYHAEGTHPVDTLVHYLREK